MPKTTAAAVPLEAALAWCRLGFRAFDTLNASAAVIARRTSRVNSPVQWAAMGQEKMTAALESWNAVSRHAATPPADWLSAWTAWARLLDSGLAPYHARATRNARRRR